jgi:hypothetical protein
MKQLNHSQLLASFPLASFGPHLVQVNEGFQVIACEAAALLSISLPAVEKRRSGEAEVAGTDNTRRASRPRKGHTFLSPHIFHSIRGSSVLRRGTVRNFHNPRSSTRRGLGASCRTRSRHAWDSHKFSTRAIPTARNYYAPTCTRGTRALLCRLRQRCGPSLQQGL